MEHEVDVVVIGMGPGGEAVAGSLAEAGLKVVGVEKNLLGGECPYWGCIPSKMIVRGADLLADGGRINGVSGSSTVTPDWARVAQRIRKEATDNWDDKAAVDRFTGKGGVFVRGEGRLVTAGTVGVGEDTYRAARGVVISVGASAVIPPIPGLADSNYWTNREILEAETLPKSLVVLGGGAIGVELAQAWSRFGVKVTVIEGADRLVPMEEPEAGETLADVLRKEGHDLRLGARAEKVSEAGRQITVRLSDGSEVSAERLLVSVGRVPKLGDLGLEHAGLDPKARSLSVDGQMRAAENVWAVGDCTGKGAFTHVAMYQASIAAASILGQEKPDATYHALPRVTFTDPEIGSVGMTEKMARDAGIQVRVGFATVASSTRGWIHGPGNEGFHKVVEDHEKGVLVGATSMGPWGGEVLSFLALAVQAQIPTSTLLNMIYAYPTFYRGVEQALNDLH